MDGWVTSIFENYVAENYALTTLLLLLLLKFCQLFVQKNPTICEKIESNPEIPRASKTHLKRSPGKFRFSV